MDGEEIGQLPVGEHDYFDRKSGELFDNAADRNQLYDMLAKAVTAFANSGGGHLILGVRDDGEFNGVPPFISGSTSTREWLEQKLPSFLVYPLVDFRVHTVTRAGDSKIPPNREIIVVDVGDSALAPHQSIRQKTYFYRSGGHSLPAPHFYLELLRQRLTNPSLDFEIESVDVDDAWKHDEFIFLRIVAKVKISNTGRVAAYKWSLVARSITGYADGRSDDYFFGGIPGVTGRPSGIRVDDTILPGCTLFEDKIFSIRLRPTTNDEQGIRTDLQALLGGLMVTMQLATETSPGQEKALAVGAIVPTDKALELIVKNGLLPSAAAK